MTWRIQPTSFSHFQPFQKNANYDLRSEANTKLWSSFLSTSLSSTSLLTPLALAPLPKGLRAQRLWGSCSRATPVESCAPETRDGRVIRVCGGQARCPRPQNLLLPWLKSFILRVCTCLHGHIKHPPWADPAGAIEENIHVASAPVSFQQLQCGCCCHLSPHTDRARERKVSISCKSKDWTTTSTHR